jgi:hypothetical protein
MVERKERKDRFCSGKRYESNIGGMNLSLRIDTSNGDVANMYDLFFDRNIIV